MTYQRHTDQMQEQTVMTLATEQRNPATTEIDRMSPLEIAQVINAEDAKVATAIQQIGRASCRERV